MEVFNIFLNVDKGLLRCPEQLFSTVLHGLIRCIIVNHLPKFEVDISDIFLGFVVQIIFYSTEHHIRDPLATNSKSFAHFVLWASVLRLSAYDREFTILVPFCKKPSGQRLVVDWISGGVSSSPLFCLRSKSAVVRCLQIPDICVFLDLCIVNVYFRLAASVCSSFLTLPYDSKTCPYCRSSISSSSRLLPDR